MPPSFTQEAWCKAPACNRAEVPDAPPSAAIGSGGGELAVELFDYPDHAQVPLPHAGRAGVAVGADSSTHAASDGPHTDLALRLARYRARAQTCNACPVKLDCTSSDAGREVTRALDPWPHSEAGRFHRGICLVLLALAAVLLAFELVRHHSPAEVALLGGLLAVVGASATRTAASFRATSANFPVAGTHA